MRKQTDAQLFNELITQYQASDADLAMVRDQGFTWTEREQLYMGVLADAGSQKTKSQVNTQDLNDIILDGATRVVSQIPTGRIQAIDQDDKGKNVLMMIVHDKYIIPHANTQWDYLTKIRMWDIYSRIFGSMPALVFHRVDGEYIGPDIELIHPRSFFPQAGVYNMQRMQYCQISSFVSVEFLKAQDRSVWKNLDLLIEKISKNGQNFSKLDATKIPYNQQPNSPQPGKGKFAEVELRTRYEKDRWVTYAPDYGYIVRDIPNPQGDHKLPVVMKHCFPLIDRLYGLAEFERGYTLQYAANSLANMYFDGVRMNLFPPIIVNSQGVVSSTLQYKPAAKWIMTQPKSIEQMSINPGSLKTFTSTYGFLKMAMNNMAGTTDTVSLPPDSKGAGKTPQAIKKQQNRENARDNWDRFMLEQALEEVSNRFISLVVTKQATPINLTIFKGDIKKIQEAYPDEKILKVFNSQEAGKLTLPKDIWNKAQFEYIINPGSTKKADENAEYDALGELFDIVLNKLPDAPQQIMETGKVKIGNKELNFGYAFERFVTTSGIQDGDRIITDVVEKPDEQQQGQQQGQIQNPEIQSLQQQMTQVSQIVKVLAEEVKKAQMKPQKSPSESIAYKDATPYIKAQMEAQAGLQPDPSHIQQHNINTANHAADESQAGLTPTGKTLPQFNLNEPQPQALPQMPVQQNNGQVNNPTAQIPA